MKPYYLLSLILAFSAVRPTEEVFAQQNAATEKSNYRISGRVVEKESGKPIAYAAAVLLEPGTGKTLTGGVADDNGEFFLTGFDEGEYILRISFMGYQTLEREGVMITAEKIDIDLGNIPVEEE